MLKRRKKSNPLKCRCNDHSYVFIKVILQAIIAKGVEWILEWLKNK